MNKEKLIAMSYDFLKFLFQEENIGEKIINIFLFGSVARNDFDDDSDVDIFINAERKNEQAVQKSADRALGRFYKIEGEKWRLKGIKNEISMKIGFLEEWHLKSSVEKEGILLFSQTPTNNLQKYLLFYIYPIKSPKKRIKISRTLFGRQEKEYKTKGLVEEYGGKILNPRVFIVPAGRQKEIATILSQEKADFGFEEVWR